MHMIGIILDFQTLLASSGEWLLIYGTGEAKNALVQKQHLCSPEKTKSFKLKNGSIVVIKSFCGCKTANSDFL